jgi:hypothetical protein
VTEQQERTIRWMIQVNYAGSVETTRARLVAIGDAGGRRYAVVWPDGSYQAVRLGGTHPPPRQGRVRDE